MKNIYPALGTIVGVAIMIVLTANMHRMSPQQLGVILGTLVTVLIMVALDQWYDHRKPTPRN